MSEMKSGGCGVLLVAVILALTIITTSWLFPGLPLVSFIITLVVLLLSMPTLCKLGTGRYYITRRGGYDIVVKEAGNPHSAYRQIDTSHITRVVIDEYSAEEHLISGEPDESYRQACLSNWEFKSISKKEPWIIIDEKGNDLTDRTLSSYQGIARIKSTAPMDRRIPQSEIEESSDKSDEYTSLDTGVEFYD